MSKLQERFEQYLGITIDYDRDNLIPEQGRALLTGKGFYKKDWEESPQQSFARASTCYCFGDYEFAQRIYDAVSKGWFTFASPVLSNAVEINWPKFKTDQFDKASDWLSKHVIPDGMPISCFLSKLSDNKKSLVETRSEASWLSMMGGGVGVYAANRAPDSKSTGVMAHLRGYDSDTLAYKQTASRRGSIAAYLDIDHPEILSFIEMRNPVGGDQNKKCFNLNNAVNITDEFMIAVIEGREYELIDPKHGRTGRFLEAREVWERIMEMRFETGEPYLLFRDTVNRNIPKWITNPLYSVSQSNLCVSGDTVISVKVNNKIKTIQIRDLAGFTEDEVLVKCYDIETGKVEWQPITAFAMTHHDADVINVNVGGQTITCTPDHQFYTKNRGYVAANNLMGSDVLVVKGVETTGASIDQTGQSMAVFDITVEKNHNFFANHVLIHNCSEITLRTSEKRTAVCCLSSLNLEKYDEWKDTTLVEDLVRLLDNVLEYFIRLAPPELKRAVHSATKERAIGLGTLGWHSFLQSKMIPFESGGVNSAVQWTHIIYGNLKRKGIEASKQLAVERGEAPDCANSGMRNSHIFAIAPNASSSSLVGASPSIEPYNGNAYTAQGRAGSFLIKNKYLEKLLEEKGMNTEAVWKSIITSDGSVQHLDFLSDFEKQVFRTSFEISPKWIIELAAARQTYICQSQSVNLFMPANTTAHEMSEIHILAWFKGLKSLYYCRSRAASKASVGTGGDKPLNSVPVRTKVELETEECLSCQG